VDDEGHILCEKIKAGDREVSPNVCRACPVAAINCAHLRATLNHEPRSPITVRYGNGKTEIWEDDAPSISLARAACAAKVIPILSPRDCAGCALRQALITPDGIAMPERPTTIQSTPPQVMAAEQVQAPLRVRRHVKSLPTQSAPAIVAMEPTAPQSVPAPVPIATAVAAKPVPVELEAENQRRSIVAQKIIKLQEWLEKQKTAAPTHASDLPEPAVALSASRAPRPSRAEEKRVGWTD
jgi:hypothetical protein